MLFTITLDVQVTGTDDAALAKRLAWELLESIQHAKAEDDDTDAAAKVAVGKLTPGFGEA